MNKQLVKIATIGSVDDGKSTLLGRILLDTGSLKQDVIDEMKEHSDNQSENKINLAYAADGLKAEREQGITIDVAYRYFQTPNRMFIIADCPGHVEYTRNQVTGVSGKSAVMILIDARHGIKEQTRRHTCISAIMGVETMIICINKMDLVEYSQDRFNEIVNSFQKFMTQFHIPNVHFIPISALNGDNVSFKSEKMNWYSGPSLFMVLDQLTPSDRSQLPTRFITQTVLRQDNTNRQDYRGIAGYLTSGKFKKGDAIKVSTLGQKTTLKGIHLGEKEYEEIEAPFSCTLLLEDDVDCGKGTILSNAETYLASISMPHLTLCWLSSTPLSENQRLILKHGSQEVKASVLAIEETFDLEKACFYKAGTTVKQNDIATISLKLSQPIYADEFSKNPYNGAVILIDPNGYQTVAAGVIA